MKRSIFLPLAFIALLTSGVAAETKGWTQLKPGMTPVETLAALGDPLIRTSGRGFEVWIYDSKAEVVFHQGPIMAWTIPTPNPVSESRPIAMDLPLGAPRRLPYFQASISKQNTQARENAPLPSTQFRYKQRF